MKPKIYTVKELAQMLNISDDTVRNEIKRGKLKCFKVGVEARFTQVHLEDYMNIRNFGMTEREMELVAENEKLLQIIDEKNNLIKSIKSFILEV